MCICIYTTSTGVSRCLPRGLRSGRWFNKCLRNSRTPHVLSIQNQAFLKTRREPLHPLVSS